MICFQALNISKECEEKLAELKKPLIILRGQADAEFDKVGATHPMLKSSLILNVMMLIVPSTNFP